MPPAVPDLRRRYPNMTDEERLLRYSFAGSQVDKMVAAGPMQTEYRFETPISVLMAELAKRPRFRYVHIENKEIRLELTSPT